MLNYREVDELDTDCEPSFFTTLFSLVWLILAKLCDFRPLFDVEHLTHELWHWLQFFMEIGENFGMSGG